MQHAGEWQIPCRAEVVGSRSGRAHAGMRKPVDSPCRGALSVEDRRADALPLDFADHHLDQIAGGDALRIGLLCQRAGFGKPAAGIFNSSSRRFEPRSLARSRRRAGQAKIRSAPDCWARAKIPPSSDRDRETARAPAISRTRESPRGSPSMPAARDGRGSPNCETRSNRRRTRHIR